MGKEALSGPVAKGRREVGCSRKKFTGDERKVEREMKVFEVGGPMELRQVASGHDTERFWLRDRKVRF